MDWASVTFGTSLVVFACIWGLTATNETPAERHLTKHLMNFYTENGPYGRPVFNVNAPIEVDMRLSLVKIVDLNFERQEMITLSWLYLNWTDDLIRWDPATASDIQVVSLPADKIWVPDIALLNAVEPPVKLHESMLNVKYTGEVRYVPAYKLTSLCVVSAESQDNPECPLTFGSVMHNTDRLHLYSTSQRAEASLYVQHPDYELYPVNFATDTRTYKCCPGESFGELTYRLRLKRRPQKKDEDTDQEESAASRQMSFLTATLAAALSLLAVNL